MTINLEDEETIRLASKKLNEQINNYKNEFSITDNQDLIAMVAFDCMVECIKNQKHSNDNTITDKVKHLSNTILSFLQRNNTKEM